MTDVTLLYEKYAASVFRFALYLSGDRALAEDLTSETFVRAWTSAAPIQMTTVKGYLFTIARHLYLQGLRKQTRHAVLPDDLLDPGASPYAQAAAKDEFSRVRDGLMRLPEIDRTALLMRALDEMPYDEIGRALGISLASVKVKIHRARVALGRLRGL
jgi:RNA polymerase sigma-70 factor (ECF subfamily)